MSEPVAGKYLLEILTSGMYSNPLHVFREYVQNACDSIDAAIEMGIVTPDQTEIHIVIDSAGQSITIEDNGIGVNVESAEGTLLSIGASSKDGIRARGFRGIGRLAGLAYADAVIFETSAIDEPVKTCLKCDCVEMRRLLTWGNSETSDVMETFQSISELTSELENPQDHYFRVILEGVDGGAELLDEVKVAAYLSQTTPVDFDSQKLSQAPEIRQYYQKKGRPLPCYKIILGRRRKSIFKPYSRSVDTRGKGKDYVRRVEFKEGYAADGSLMYIAWVAITDFIAASSDEQVSGLRFRKGNILVGDRRTATKLFTETTANSMFVGEIHAFHDGLIPNSQRDDFERSPMYDEFIDSLSGWAMELNRKYRRGAGQANNAQSKLERLLDEYETLRADVLRSGVISSDEKREQCLARAEKLRQQIVDQTEKVRKYENKSQYPAESRQRIQKLVKTGEEKSAEIPSFMTKVSEQDYATKTDLPSSYGKKERKLYQRIIGIIDTFFKDDPGIAEALRGEIVEELNKGKR